MRLTCIYFVFVFKNARVGDETLGRWAEEGKDGGQTSQTKSERTDWTGQASQERKG